VCGDSMAPVIHENSIIVVDSAVTGRDELHLWLADTRMFDEESRRKRATLKPRSRCEKTASL
jgi:phage repressor protein C with HTH and peptisase S24 domain